MARFCAICGKTITDKAPHFGMCLECYLKEHPLFELPESFSFKICQNCLSYAKKNKWTKTEAQDFEDIIKDALSRFLLENIPTEKKIQFKVNINHSSIEYTSKNLIQALNANIIGAYAENSKIRHTQKMRVHVNYELCKNCERLMSGTYFSSIIQIRVKNENEFDFLKDVLEEIQAYVEDLFQEDPKQYISKIVNQKYGVDLYLSTNELMGYIISFLRGKYQFLLKKSKKLIGRDSQGGKNIYRFKVLIKFLPFEKNDVIMINNEKFTIKAILKNKVVMINNEGEKISKKFEFFF
jgi:NMD protein affecting ribosome stability and mRNA decay